MGAVVGVINKKGENAATTAIEMMHELTHRGNGGYGVATYECIKTATTFEEVKNTNTCNLDVVIGHNLSCIMPRDKPQPVQGDGFTIIFEGRLFPAPSIPGEHESEKIAKKLGSKPLRNAEKIFEKGGAYVFAIAEKNRILAGRDVFGTVPLYYGENQTFCAVASERKALWKIGIKDVQAFPPGKLAVISNQGFAFHKMSQLHVPPKEKIDMETASKALHLLLMETNRKQFSDLDSVAVAFSGGVDSSVVAALARDIGLDVQLISVGLENQPEVMFTEQAAEALGLPIHVQTYTVKELEETIPKVLWLTEESNPVSACIAVPFYWLAETASKLDQPVLLAGQGADEIFGGYQRYLTDYKNSGEKGVDEKLLYDVENAYSANFQRDNQVCAYHGVELRLPFINKDVIQFGLRLPLQFKIKSPEDNLRKHILRKVAHDKFEVSKLLSDKPKKAVQYTTGVTKALQRIAKQNNMTLQEYVDNAFKKVHC
ncbi:MAG: asparagine synthetase B [Candidatus Bathyarchaeota archaeon]|nr:asparagine synthetase B [Candidatus Bathyarchaeum sp.]